MDVPRLYVISRDLKGWKHDLSTNAIINEISPSQSHVQVSFWKWIPPGRDNSRRMIGSIAPLNRARGTQ